MPEKIKEKLKNLEKSNDITILYAVESGSRAWGHPNKNSDYDIRFIYKNNDINEYLTINTRKDVIESNDGIYDIVGWDIKKALLLHYKNNPNLREWLLSPIKYIENKENIFKNLPEFNPSILKHHYYGLSKRHYKKYLKENKKYDLKFFKKLLYTIRCVLAWKMLDDNIFPPMNMDELINTCKLDDNLKDNIIKIKDSYCQLNTDNNEETIEYLIKWIEDSLEYMANDNTNSKCNKDIEIYNKRFQEIITSTYNLG